MAAFLFQSALNGESAQTGRTPTPRPRGRASPASTSETAPDRRSQDREQITAANDNLRAGVDPASVAAWLGHDDLKTLMVYGKPTRAAMEDLAETVTYRF